MSPYNSLLPSDRPSALGSFLMPLAEGFAGGIEEDRLRRRNIADKVQAYKALMPAQMETFTQQHEILGKMQEERDARALEKALRLKAYEQEINPEFQARKRLGELLQLPQSTTTPAGAPFPQEGTGEAMGKPESWTGVRSVPQTSPGVTRQQLAPWAVQAGMVKTPKDLRSLLRDSGGPAPRALQGFDVVPTYDADGDVTGYRQVRTPAASPASLNNPYGLARSVVGLEPGQQPTAEQAKQIYSIVERHAKAKGISPRSQVFNDVLASTGDTRAAEQAAVEFEEMLARASGRGRTVGANTGEAREARVATAEATGAAGVRGKASAELEPIASPMTGQPVPRVTAVKEAQAAGETVPASERKALSELSLLQQLTEAVKRDSKNFSEPFFGPITGRLGTIRESYTGDMGPAEVSVRRNLGDIKDTLLRARSGAQINEQEYNRLSRLVPDINDPPTTAKYKMESFKSALEIITKERMRLQGITGGQVATKGSLMSVGSSATTVSPSSVPKPGRQSIAVELQGEMQAGRIRKASEAMRWLRSKGLSEDEARGMVSRYVGGK